MASRQRDYQKRNKASGLCIQCPSPSLPKKGRCFRHQVFYKLREYGMAKGRLSAVNSNKREKLVAHLAGRYHAVVQGFLEPGDQAQRLKDSTEIRLRLYIKWGGVRGARKLAAVIKSFDRLATQVNRERHASREPSPTA